jgi:hypothetical protein
MGGAANGGRSPRLFRNASADVGLHVSRVRRPRLIASRRLAIAQLPNGRLAGKRTGT